MEQDIPHLSNLAATISTRAVLEAVLTERGGVLGGQATSGLDGEPVAAIHQDGCGLLLTNREAHIDSCANNTKSENMINSMATRSYVRQKSDRRKGKRQNVSMSTRSHTVLKVFLGSSHFGLRIHVIAEPYSIGDTPLALGPRRCHGLSLDIAKSCSIDDDSQHSFRRKVAVLAPRGRGRAAASYDGSRSN